MFVSIQRRLVLACVAIVVLALTGITAVNLLVVRDSTRDSTTRELDTLAQAQAQGIASWVQQQKAIVAALAPAVGVADAVPFLVQAQRSGGLVSAYAGYPDKRMLFDVQQQLPPGYDPTVRPWYVAATASQDTVLTAPYADAATKRLIVTFARAVREAGTVQAVVASDVFIDDVSKAVASIKPTPQGLAFLVDRNGRVIAHPDTQWILKPATDMAASLDAAALARTAVAEGAWVEAQMAGQDYLLRGAPVVGTDWTLVTAARADEALADLSMLLRVAAVALVVMALIAGMAATWAVSSVLGGLARVRDAMRQIGQGEADLTLRLPEHGGDEIAQIAAAFNRFTDKLSATIRTVRQTSDSIAVASAEIASGNTDLSHRTEQTAGSLQQAASSLEELTGTVRHSAVGAATASQLATEAAGVAQRGGQVVAAVVSTMDEIHASSRRINDIIGTIDGIAFQTNILALNAAVEAARAGEQGRGFAVVASEVRNLAQRSAQAAREIKTLIGSSVERVENGSRLVADAGSTMAEIVGSVQRVTQVIAEISAASNEQSQGIAQVNGAVNELDRMTQQNSALVEQSAAAAESLKDQALRLASVVSTFKLAA